MRSVAEDSYDHLLLHAARAGRERQGDAGFVPAARVIGEALARVDDYVPDSYLIFPVRPPRSCGGMVDEQRYDIVLREDRA